MVRALPSLRSSKSVSASVVAIRRRAASTHASDDHGHHHTHDNYQYSPEGFFTPFWRNTVILSFLGYGVYRFMPSRTSLDGKEGSLTSRIRNTLTPADTWKERNEKHLALSLEAAEAKHLTGSARRPLMPRTRYPGKFEDASPHKQAVGDQIDFSTLLIKEDTHMKHAQ